MQGDAAKAVAWLHDVVEDTPLTFAELQERGVAPEVIEALRLLTHDESVPYLEYVRSLKSNALARAVNLPTCVTTAIYPGFRASPKRTNGAQRNTQRPLPFLRGRGQKAGSNRRKAATPCSITPYQWDNSAD